MGWDSGKHQDISEFQEQLFKMFGNVLYQPVALMTTKEADVQQKQLQEIEGGWFWNVRGTRSLPRQNCAVVSATCHISP